MFHFDGGSPAVRPIRKKKKDIAPLGMGRRIRTSAADKRGISVGHRRVRKGSRPTDLALAATLVAAASRRRPVCKTSKSPLVVESIDLRQRVREKRAGASILFVVDASGSMRKNQRMKEAKAAVLALLSDAYHKRDRVGLVAFRGTGARVLLPMTNSVTLAKKRLSELPAGGKTPLGEGIRTGLAELAREVREVCGRTGIMVVVSDGKPNSSPRGVDPLEDARKAAAEVAKLGMAFVFLDSDATWQEPGMGRELARLAKGTYTSLSTLSAEHILRALAEAMARGRVS